MPKKEIYSRNQYICSCNLRTTTKIPFRLRCFGSSSDSPEKKYVEWYHVQKCNDEIFAVKIGIRPVQYIALNAISCVYTATMTAIQENKKNNQKTKNANRIEIDSAIFHFEAKSYEIILLDYMSDEDILHT